MARKKAVWVGIDSGKTGGVAAIFVNGSTERAVLDAEAWHTPSITTRTKRPRKKTPAGNPSYKVETVYDLYGMLRLMNEFQALPAANWEVHIALELQRPRQRDSKHVAMMVGYGQALWEMAVAANGLTSHLELLAPTVWKPVYLPPKADKKASLALGRELFPSVDMPLEKDEAKAEALLIADYIRRRDLGVPFLRERPAPKKRKKK